jgi:hypothetical protein
MIDVKHYEYEQDGILVQEPFVNYMHLLLFNDVDKIYAIQGFDYEVDPYLYQNSRFYIEYGAKIAFD